MVESLQSDGSILALAGTVLASSLLGGGGQTAPSPQPARRTRTAGWGST